MSRARIQLAARPEERDSNQASGVPRIIAMISVVMVVIIDSRMAGQTIGDQRCSTRLPHSVRAISPMSGRMTKAIPSAAGTRRRPLPRRLDLTGWGG